MSQKKAPRMLTREDLEKIISLAAQRSTADGYSEEDVIAAITGAGLNETLARKCLADYCSGTLSPEEQLALLSPAERQMQKRWNVLKGVGKGVLYVPKKIGSGVWSAAGAVKSWWIQKDDVTRDTLVILGVAGLLVTLGGSAAYFSQENREQEAEQAALEHLEYFCGNPAEVREESQDGAMNFSAATLQCEEAIDNSHFFYNDGIALVSYISSLAGPDAEKATVCGIAAHYVTALDNTYVSIDDGIALFGYLASISGSERDLREVGTAAERYATFLGSQRIDIDDGIEHLQAVSGEGGQELDELVDQAILHIMNGE